MHDWLTDLLSTPVKDYTNFEAALSFLPALPPDDVADLLRERAARLEFDLAESQGSRELIEKKHFPRLLWVEEEFRMVLREAELDLRPETGPRNRERDARRDGLVEKGARVR